MIIHEGYILLTELAKFAGKSASWGYNTKGIEVEYAGSVPIVKKNTLPEKYQLIAEKCYDLSHYMIFAYFSREIGKTKEYLSVLDYQRRKANKPQFESITVNHYKLLKLSTEFVNLVKKGLTPYKLSTTDDKDDYEYIVEMQGLKIGFY